MLVSICSVPECAKSVTKREWCELHYRRWLKHGDPEGGRVRNGETERHLRDVVFTYTGDECLIWPYMRNPAGYAYLNNRKGGSNIVSRLVCEEANGPPPTPEHQGAHSCGNGHLGCVSPRHLSWKTNAENALDMVAHGRTTRGPKHWRAKLTTEQALEIKSLLGTMLQRDIAKRYGVTPAMIAMIKTGRAWAWL